MGRVLLVSKSSSLRTGFSSYLQAQHVETHTAKSIAEGQELLAILTPDVTVFDIDVHNSDAFLLVGQIFTAGSRCLVMSERADIKRRIQFLELGVDDYIIKPIDFQETYLRLRNIIVNRFTSRVGISGDSPSVEVIAGSTVSDTGAPYSEDPSGRPECAQAANIAPNGTDPLNAAFLGGKLMLLRDLKRAQLVRF